METTVLLGIALCAVSVLSQPQSLTPATDCAMFFEECDQEFEASQKDMVQVNDYYQCLRRIQGCDFVQDEERERRIVDLKIFVANVCPSCRQGEKVWTTPTPEADEMPGESCENKIFDCTTHKDNSMTRFDMLHEAFICVQRPMECSDHEELLRQAVTNTIVTEMAIACPDCLVPNPPPSMHMTDTRPEDVSCRSLLTLCNAKFNVKESNYWSFESLYMCIAKISNCDSDMESTLRRQQMDVLAMTLKGMCPNCTMVSPAPPVQPTCLEAVYYCSTHAIDERFTVRYNALRKVHECALELNECDSTEENNLRLYLVHHVRMEMELECGQCNFDMPQVPDDIMDAIDNAMPPEHPTCMESITSCQSIFNIRPRGQRRYEEMYQCIQRDDNCTPEEMEVMEEEMAEEEHPLRRRKRSALLSVLEQLPSSKMEAVEISTCRFDIAGCKQKFQATPVTCSNRFAYMTCLATLRNCRMWEEELRMQYISEQFDVIQKECTVKAVNSDYKAEQPPVSCHAVFSSCSQAFYSSNRNQSTANQFYECLRQPEGCEEWEDFYRQEMLQTSMTYMHSTEIQYKDASARTYLAP